MTAKETLIYIIDVLTCYLEDLKHLPKSDFIQGERIAYVETLEIIQMWKESKLHGLQDAVEDKYPL